MKSCTLTFLIAAALALPLAAQPEGYVDYDMVHVKPGKRMEFDAINRRLAEMNRKNGDHWTAMENIYGDSNAVYFVSTRPTFAAAAQGIRNFENAVTNAVGAAGMHKLFNDFDATVESEQESIFHRRWDLSTEVPSDAGALAKVIGEARWVRMVTIYTQPGRALDFEAQERLNKEANERANAGIPFWVMQSVAGAATGVYRIVNLMKSLDEMDKLKSVQQARGDSYPAFMKTEAETVARVDIAIGRVVPELSNPPDDIANVDTSFWRPKVAAASASAKPKAAGKQ